MWNCNFDRLIAALLCAVTVAFCVHYTALYYGDFPDHLARARVIADLLFHDGAHFGAIFQFHPMPIPYLLGDLLLSVVVELLGAWGATVIWTVLMLVALPLAMHFYLYVMRAGRHSRALFFIVGLYCSLDWFFIAGFANFRLAIAMVIFSLALVQSLRRSWSQDVFCAYLVTVVLGYLMHLSFVLFLATAIGATAAWRLRLRVTTIRAELWLVGPVVGMLVWHAMSVTFFPQAAEVVVGHVDWGSVGLKLRHLDWGFVRLSAPTDWLVALGIAACPSIAIALLPGRREGASLAVIDLVAMAVAFVALYFVLPMRHGDITYIDVRALALATPLAMFALLLSFDERAGENGRARLFVCGVLAILGFASLAGLAPHLEQSRAWLTDYRALTRSVPAKANVLPVYTRALDVRWRPYIHDAPLAVVVDRNAVVPSMFSGDRGQPMKYFRYIHRRYEPASDWYIQRMPGKVDWGAVACDYDFLLVTAPYSPEYLRVGTTVAAQNSSGALLKVDRRQCHGATG